MSGDDYAPKSPDLSSFLTDSRPTQNHQPPAPPPFSLDNTSAYQPHHLHQQQAYHQNYNSSYQAPHTTQKQQNYTSDYVPPIKTEYSAYAPPNNAPLLSPPAHPTYFDPNFPQQLPPQHYEQPQGVYYSPAQSSQSYSQTHRPFVEPAYTTPPTAAPAFEQEIKDEYTMPPRKAAAAALVAEEPPSPIIEPSPVKTKFPTARIKRIMQADEEVGKVAQQTPIAVGKALELFMVQLVSKSADIAKDKGSKRVTASMLKQVVETDEQWDFLREIVGKVENEKEGSKQKPKQESESEEEDAYEPKKRGRGRKKKAA